MLRAASFTLRAAHQSRLAFSQGCSAGARAFSTANTDKVVTATVENFDEHLNSEGLVIVDFTAEWCPPCRMLGPVLKSVVPENGGKLIIVDTDDSPEIATRYSISSLPTVLAFREGKRLGAFVGAQPASFVQDFMKKY
ncbi:hypothetical protein H696_00008 [Fonticula alba]|uniref:Thioredoxin domain-containing protein n=1 Tax=Fonticula alba TaxID=691883 RepID=A0A058ZES4_FONAL|nr:hypothetical protein H696_00008 [Fonticula alba]KCV72423.1 hypothetical protein H696_00008 [Fonticula alba]|eukprot:XP_009492124.1 hypothetical protein H696_00008 [Fonticula alba]